MATGSVAITPGVGDNVRTITNAGVDSGAKQQVLTLGAPDGQIVPHDPDGTLQVSPEPTGLFIDDFSGTLSSFWTTGGTAPASTTGVLATSSATTASLASYMRTIGTFWLRSGSYLLNANLVRFEAAALTNNSRWWGIGTNQGSPTAAAPVLNGAVFLLDYSTGGLYAATYSAGTRTSFQALTRATDLAYHRYEIRYRQSVIYWVIDGTSVASLSQPNLAVAANLPVIVGSANFTTAPSTGPLLNVTSVGVSDLSGTGRTLSDGNEPWKMATVKAGSTAAVAADLPLIVAQHPSSPTPAGTALIGAVAVGATTRSSSFTVSTTTNTATQLKTSAGDLQALLIANTSTSAQYVKLFNATAVTLGTTAAVIDVPVAAGTTLSLNLGANGLRFTTGMFYAVTGAAGTTNNTAGAGGVSVAATYI